MNKRGINQLDKLQLDPLISEKENLDWFIYDDESLKFLMDMEKEGFIVVENVKKHPNNKNKVYFQDKYKYMLLSNKEYKSFYITLNLGTVKIILNLDVNESRLISHNYCKRFTQKSQCQTIKD